MTTSIRYCHVGAMMILAIGVAAQASARDVGYAVAARHYQLEEWEAAAVGFANVLTARSTEEEHLSAQFFLSECQMQLGQYAQAREGYQQLLELPYSQYSTRALFRAGESAFFAGAVEESRKLLQQFLVENPRDPLAALAVCHLADQQRQSENTEAAIALYRRVLDNYPHSEHISLARLGLAKTLLLAGKLDQVAEAVGTPENYQDKERFAESLLIAGRAKHQSGDYAGAVHQFRKIFESHPKLPAASRARIAAAWSLWREEKFAEVGEIVAPLSEQSEWLADYHYLTGMAAYGGGDWAIGAKHLALAIRIHSDHPSVDAIIFYQGVCYLKQNRSQAAKHLLQRLQAEHPNSAWLDDAERELAKLGVESTTSSAENAASQLSESAPLQDSYIGSFYDAGPLPEAAVNGANQNLEKVKELLDEAVALERDGRYDGAIAAYQELIAIESSAEEKLEGVRRCAKLLQQLKRYEKSSSLYREFLQHQPDAPYAAAAMAALGWMQIAQGEVAAAKQILQELVEKFPQSPQVADATYWLARLAADEDDSDKANYYLRLAEESLAQSKEATADQLRLLAQSVALRCQLAAQEEDWQAIKDIAPETLESLPEGVEHSRLAFWLAESEFRSKQYNQARDKFAELDARTFGIQEEWVAMVSLRRAQLAARRQQWKEVLNLVERIDREFPEFQMKYEADYLRGRAEAGLGNYSAARTAYEEVRTSSLAEATETSIAAQWMIGETYFHQQNYESARSNYQVVLEQQAPATWRARAALQIGKCWELQEDWEQARAVYGEALRRWPDAEPQEKILARLRWAEDRAKLRR